MTPNVIDAKLLCKMFLSGAQNLEANKEIINELNVFPVPDGDTGTNMTLTIMSAANDVNALEDPDMKTLCKTISSGSLRGARGNSGVILSQLLRGFTKVVRDYDELDVAVISAGFDKAVETAYKAVMKPKEGTILTVAKGMAVKANELFESGEDDLKSFFDEIIKEGQVVLDKTPDMLPVLKEAGVVDSGGQGLLEVVKGAYDAFLGKEVVFSMDEGTAKEAGATRLLESKPEEDAKKPAYSVSFKVLLEGKVFNVKKENDYRDYLETIGESVIVEVDEIAISVKVDTDDPGLPIQKAIKYGQLTNIDIQNLVVGNIADIAKDVAPAKDEPRKSVGFISVSAGDGIGAIFKNLGVDYLIEGGQTMNPSTEDILIAISKVNADTVYVFPNNKNIIMAANQARDLTEDKNVIVIPTKTVPQGITALISFVPDLSPEENEEAMVEALKNVKTGQLTYAVRDTVIEGFEIHEGDYMAVGDSGILANGKEIDAVFMDMLDNMVDDSTEVISIYYGADVNADDAEAIKNKVAEKYSSIDVDMEVGNQPVYYYIVSAE